MSPLEKELYDALIIAMDYVWHQPDLEMARAAVAHAEAEADPERDLQMPSHAVIAAAHGYAAAACISDNQPNDARWMARLAARAALKILGREE